MTRPKLHLDADTSRKALLEGLLDRGHDVTRTPQPGLPDDTSDDLQLLWATGQGRIFLRITFAILSVKLINFRITRELCLRIGEVFIAAVDCLPELHADGNAS
jgi:hypothetical protein